MNKKSHVNLSTQSEISDMIKRIKYVKDVLKIEIRYFVSSLGTVKVQFNNTWVLYREAEEYLPYLKLES